MTIYYDDPKDIEHQRTVEQAKDLRLQSSHQFGIGASEVILGSVIGGINNAVEKPSRIAGIVSWVVSFMGLFDAAKSYFTGTRAHDLELKAERTVEPKHILLTSQSSGIDIIPETFHRVEDEKPKFLADIEPKTHQDYAAQTTTLERS